MTQNEAYILAGEVKGSAYCAGLYFWRVKQRLNKQTVRYYNSRADYWDVVEYGS